MSLFAMRATNRPVITVRGANVELTALAQERLADRVRAFLEEGELEVSHVTLTVFEAADGALSCSLDVFAQATVQLTVRESAPFLAPAVDQACARTVDALDRLHTRFSAAFEAAAYDLAQAVSQRKREPAGGITSRF